MCVSLSIEFSVSSRGKTIFFFLICVPFIILFIYLAKNILANVSNTMINNSEDNGHFIALKEKESF